MTIQLQVPPALELRLREEAAVRGEDVETVVINALAERFGAETHNADKPRWSLQEFDAELVQLAFNGPSLPADFSRADIYGAHD